MTLDPPNAGLRPRRIALVTTTLSPGGAERCLARIACGLDRARFEPFFYSLQPPPRPEQSQLVAELTQAGVPIHYCHATGIWDAWRVASELRERFIADGIELIQAFLFHANVLGAFAAWRAGGIPVVLGLRADEPSWFRRVVGAWGASGAARITCVSQSVADSAKAAGFAAEKLVVIPNGIDVRPYCNVQSDTAALAATGLSPERKWLLTIGRLEEQKGLDWLLEECATWIFENLLEHDLAIVGEGPQRAELEEICERLELTKRVHFLGWRSDVPALLARAEMLLLPSRWEGMPNVVLEAMAAGKPVVATDVAGVRELLGCGSREQVIDLNAADSFTLAVAELGHATELRHSLGKANRARAEQEFSIERMVAKYAQIYDEVLQERESPERK